MDNPEFAGSEIVGNIINPKMQHIVYAHFQDGYVEYDTVMGMIWDDDSCLFGDMCEDDALEARDIYYAIIEILFGTEWGIKHSEILY